MRRKRAVLVTGANGEIGHTLITALKERDADAAIVALDLHEADEAIAPHCIESVKGNILDRELLAHLGTKYEIGAIYHLAALLSTRGEFSPELAHDVNVNGTMNLLALALEEGRSHGERVRFFFPSSIAVHGLHPDVDREGIPPVDEDGHLNPITMYGCNKLYVEHVGRYYQHHYRQLAAHPEPSLVDFRGLRFPGLLSAFTEPSGGTSDYAPEIVHNAARGVPYDCFVAKDTRLPFMAMPDAVDAILDLMSAPAEKLTRAVYDIQAFAPTAGEFAERAIEAFPDARIGFSPDPNRHRIVLSWPARLDDGRARADWGYAPAHDLERTFGDYLLPNVRARYA